MISDQTSDVQDDIEFKESRERVIQNQSSPDAPLNTSGDETVSLAAGMNVIWHDPSPSMPDPNGVPEVGNSNEKYAQIYTFPVSGPIKARESGYM